MKSNRHIKPISSYGHLGSTTSSSVDRFNPLNSSFMNTRHTESLSSSLSSLGQSPTSNADTASLSGKNHRFSPSESTMGNRTHVDSFFGSQTISPASNVTSKRTVTSSLADISLSNQSALDSDPSFDSLHTSRVRHKVDSDESNNIIGPSVTPEDSTTTHSTSSDQIAYQSSGNALTQQRLPSAPPVNVNRRVTNQSGRIERIYYNTAYRMRVAQVRYDDDDDYSEVIPAIRGMKKGQFITSTAGMDTIEIAPGNMMPLHNIPIGTTISNIEMFPGHGAHFLRRPGTHGRLVAKDMDMNGICYGIIQVNGREDYHIVNLNCVGTIGCIDTRPQRNPRLKHKHSITSQQLDIIQQLVNYPSDYAMISTPTPYPSSYHSFKPRQLREMTANHINPIAMIQRLQSNIQYIPPYLFV